MKRILLASLLLAVLMLSSIHPTSAYNIPVFVHPGDEFQIKITSADSYDEVNGTKYVTDPLPFSAGDIATIKVVDVYDDGDTTKVNTTGDVGGQPLAGETEVNDWEFIVLFILVAAFTIGFFDPDSLSFEKPTVTTVPTSAGEPVDTFPIFATNNESYYQEYVSSFSSGMSSTSTTTPPYTVNQEQFTADYNADTKTFKTDIIWDLSDEGTNGAGLDWTWHLKLEIHIVIDVERSFVTLLSLLYSFTVTLEDASATQYMSVGWEEYQSESTNSEGGALNSLTENLPGLTFIMTLLGFLALIPIIRKQQ